MRVNPFPVKWALHEMGLMGDGMRLPLTPLSDLVAMRRSVMHCANAVCCEPTRLNFSKANHYEAVLGALRCRAARQSCGCGVISKGEDGFLPGSRFDYQAAQDPSPE